MSINDDWTIIEMENAKGHRPLPKWQRTIMVDTNGAAWVPLAMFGDEAHMMQDAGWHGWAVVLHEKHAFAKVDDVIAQMPEFSQVKDVVDSIVANSFPV